MDNHGPRGADKAEEFSRHRPLHGIANDNYRRWLSFSFRCCDAGQPVHGRPKRSVRRKSDLRLRRSCQNEARKNEVFGNEMGKLVARGECGPSGGIRSSKAAKQLLDDSTNAAPQRFLYGTSIEAFIRNRVSKLWLLNYSHPDMTMGTHPWGIFLEKPDGSLESLYVYKPSPSEQQYAAYFVASLDLNGDGNDDLVIEASYRLGTAFKVISLSDGKYRERYTSYYRGPA